MAVNLNYKWIYWILIFVTRKSVKQMLPHFHFLILVRLSKFLRKYITGSNYYFTFHNVMLQKNMPFILRYTLALNLLISLNKIIHFPFLELPIVILRDIKMKTWSWSTKRMNTWNWLAKSIIIEPGQTTQMGRLVWLYNGGKG